jgi:hypothetical protein
VLHVIRDVQVSGECELTLTWDDGTSSTVDFAPIIEQGGVFAPLADPAFFRQVQLGERRRFITWPGEIDVCADALYLRSRSVVVS